MARRSYSSRDLSDSLFFQYVITSLCQQSGKNLQQISQESRVPIQELNRMKNGQKVISFQSFGSLYTYFTGEEFDFSDEIADRIQRDFNRFIVMYINVDTDPMLEIVQDILKQREIYENSFGYFLWHLCCFFDLFWNYDINKPVDKDILAKIHAQQKICQAGFETFTPVQKAFFLDISGMQAVEEGDFQNGLNCFYKALDYTSDTALEGHTQMIRYHIARISDKVGGSLFGLLTCRELSRYYASRHNMLRSLYIEIVSTYLYTDLEAFDLGERQALSIIRSSKNVTDPDVENFARRTLVWNAICAGWHEKALNYIDESDENALSAIITGWKPYLYMLAGDLDTAREVLENQKKSPRPPKIELLHAVLDDVLNQRQRMFLRSWEKLRRYCQKNGFHQTERLCYQIKIWACRQWEMDEEYARALEQMILFQAPAMQNGPVLPDLFEKKQ